MSNKITCTCGHSWNKSSSSKKDMRICHICGKDNTMKNGGWLDKFDAPQAENGLEASTDGFTDQGFNYNGAWGGTMEDGGDIPQAQNGLWNTNKTQWVDSIHNARRGDLDFVNRYFDPSAGSIPTPRDVEGWKPGQTSTHLMAYDPGSRRVYPQVVNANGKLQYMPGDQGWNYADDTKQFIEFPTAEQAAWYSSNGYKKGTNVLKGKTSAPKKAMGGNIPGSVGFTYARTKGIPDNGPYAKKTMASAQDGLTVDEQMAEASTNMWGYPIEPNFVEAYKKPTKKTTSKKTSTKSKSVEEETDEPDSVEEKKSTVNFRANRERPQMDALRSQTPIVLDRYSPYTGYIREGDSDPNKWNDPRSIFSDARTKERGEKLWDGTKKVTALTQFVPLIGLPSKVLNTGMGLTDAYYSNREKDPLNTLINIAGAMPSGNKYISGIQALSDLTDNFGFEKKPEKKQNGGEMSFYQNGLDWTPRNISKNGSQIPQAEDGEEVTLDDLLKVVNKRAVADNTNSGIQAKVSKQIGAQKSSNQKAEQKVQTLINKAGYSEPHARRAVRTKTDTQANKALENIDTDVYRTQMHPDYNPNIPVDQQTQLLNDNSLRARLLRGSNMLTNTGNPLTDFAAGMFTAPGRSFANLTMDAGNRYFSPNNTGLGNFANFAEDAVNVVPSIIPKAAGALGPAESFVNQQFNILRGRDLPKRLRLPHADPSLRINTLDEFNDALNNWTTAHNLDTDNFNENVLVDRFRDLGRRHNVRLELTGMNDQIMHMTDPERSRFFTDFYRTMPERIGRADFAPAAPTRRGRTLIPSGSSSNFASYSGPRNKSGLAKEQVLEKLSGKNKEIVSKMTDDEFRETVLKPTGEVVPYTEGDGLSYLSNDQAIQPLSFYEYSEAFNKNLPLLNSIIAKNNKSGVNFEVQELTPQGRLTFNTPAGQTAKKYPLKGKSFREILNTPVSHFFNKETIPVKEGTKSWGTGIVPGVWAGEVQDVANANYFKNIPGLRMNNSSSGIFPDDVVRRGTNAYGSINEYLKQMELGRVKPGFNSQTKYSRGLWENAIKKGKASGYYDDPYTVYGSMKKEGGEITKDDNGYWNPENWGKPVEIGSNNITMKGLQEMGYDNPLLGISDTGDTQMMYPGEDYKFKGKKVTEYPIAEDGYTGSSVVDYLSTKGLSSTKSARKELAREFNVDDYDYSSGKNLELLEKLRNSDEKLNKMKKGYTPISVERLEQMLGKKQDKKAPSPASNTSKKPINKAMLDLMMMQPSFNPNIEKPALNLADATTVSSEEISPIQTSFGIDPSAWNTSGFNPRISRTQPSGAPLPQIDTNMIWNTSGASPRVFDQQEENSSLPNIDFNQAWNTSGTSPRNINTQQPFSTVPTPLWRSDAAPIPNTQGAPFSTVPNPLWGNNPQVNQPANDLTNIGDPTAINAMGIPNLGMDAINDVVNYVKKGIKYGPSLAKRMASMLIGDDESTISKPLAFKKLPVVNNKEEFSKKEFDESPFDPITTGNIRSDEHDTEHRGPGFYHTNEMIDLDKFKFGFHNREGQGSTTDKFNVTKTEGLVIPVFDKEYGEADGTDAGGTRSIRKYKDSEIKDTKLYGGVDDKGKFYLDYGKNLKGKDLTMADFRYIDATGFAKDANGNFVLGNETSNNKIAKVPHLINTKGKEEHLNILVPKLGKDQHLKYGDTTGGRMILTTPDMKHKFLASGSLQDLNDTLEEFKKRFKTESVRVVVLDNGTFSRGLRKTNKKIYKNDWKKYDEANDQGGAGFYYYKDGGEVKPATGWLDKYN